MLTITPTGESCGAEVTGVDLSLPLENSVLSEIRAAWLKHHVLVFPNQAITDQQLENITQAFGRFSDDPYFVPMEGSDHVVALTRSANETAPVFAESWHTDWSFQENPPIGTCLYSITIPPVGGDTGFINQHKALAEMPEELRARLQGKKAMHSAGVAYAPDGMYGEREKDSDRTMKILYSEDAREVQPHEFIKVHEENGMESLFGCLGYIMGVQDMEPDEAKSLILDLYQWQTRPEFQYTHKWKENMLVIWDNRSVLHKANGGYDGYDRELHRTTVRRDPTRFLAVT